MAGTTPAMMAGTAPVVAETAAAVAGTALAGYVVGNPDNVYLTLVPLGTRRFGLGV